MMRSEEPLVMATNRSVVGSGPTFAPGYPFGGSPAAAGFGGDENRQVKISEGDVQGIRSIRALYAMNARRIRGLTEEMVDEGGLADRVLPDEEYKRFCLNVLVRQGHREEVFELVELLQRDNLAQVV
jgi:hypothetical protein